MSDLSRTDGNVRPAQASTWTFGFAAQNGGTRLDLLVDYTVPIPVLGKLAEALVVRQNEKELETVMANSKARVED